MFYKTLFQFCKPTAANIFCGLLIWLTVIQNFYCQSQQNISVTSQLDTNAMLIGDQTVLRLSVEHSSNVKVVWPVLPDTLGQMEVVKRSKVDTTKVTSGALTFTQDFWITAFDSGYYNVPALSITYTTGDDTLQKTASSQPQILRVNSLAVDTTKEIMDIKPPIAVPFSLWEYFKENYKWVIGGLAILLGAGALYYLLRRRKPAIRQAKLAPTKPPFEVALESLKRIEQERLWQRGEYKLYHSQIADTIRQFIERIFQVHAMELTTDEILYSLRNIPSDQKVLLRKILGFADLVKFAKSQPSAGENEESIATAFNFIGLARPVETASNFEPKQQ